VAARLFTWIVFVLVWVPTLSASAIPTLCLDVSPACGCCGRPDADKKGGTDDEAQRPSCCDPTQPTTPTDTLAIASTREIQLSAWTLPPDTVQASASPSASEGVRPSALSRGPPHRRALHLRLGRLLI